MEVVRKTVPSLMWLAEDVLVELANLSRYCGPEKRPFWSDWNQMCRAWEQQRVDDDDNEWWCSWHDDTKGVYRPAELNWTELNCSGGSVVQSEPTDSSFHMALCMRQYDERRQIGKAGAWKLLVWSRRMLCGCRRHLVLTGLGNVLATDTFWLTGWLIDCIQCSMTISGPNLSLLWMVITPIKSRHGSPPTLNFGCREINTPRHDVC